MAPLINSASSLPMINRLQNAIDDYFDLKNSSWSMTALKVSTYMTLVIPALMLTIKTCLQCILSSSGIIQAVTALSPIPLPENLLAVINASPAFNGYKTNTGTPLLTQRIRPANLLYQALLGQNCTTMPGNRGLFRFTVPFNQVRDAIQQAQDIDVTAEGQGELEDLYGANHFHISRQELQETLDSQRIYCAPLLPRSLYRILKRVMDMDEIVTLPNVKFRNLNGTASRIFIAAARQHPETFDVQNDEDLNQILDLTMYQLGSLVVKTEDFRILIDAEGKIRERNPGDQDALRLINACGIRNIHQTGDSPIPNRTILTQMFSTSLLSAQNGYLVMPAVGMGVWGGDPAVYWPALLDAIVNMNVPIEKIFINPGHQLAQGMNGNEFQQYLNQYLSQYVSNPRALANLQKVVNLFEKRTDIVHFSQNLKKAFPEKTVSIFNASDPDVTLGYHVGEYVNSLEPASTTEENFTALGTNGLCFEGITQIHNHVEKIIQA